MPTPSFQTQVAQIFTSRCYPCHGPGGIEQFAHDFTSYANIHSQRLEILTQVAGCTMPPPGNPPPTTAERAALLAWLVCSAPNN
jgi:hypothetical protein